MPEKDTLQHLRDAKAAIANAETALDRSKELVGLGTNNHDKVERAINNLHGAKVHIDEIAKDVLLRDWERSQS